MNRLSKFGLGDSTPATPAAPLSSDVIEMTVFSNGSAIDNQGNYYPAGGGDAIPIESLPVAAAGPVPSSWDHFTHWLGEPVATGWPITNATAIIGAALLTAAFSRKGRR